MPGLLASGTTASSLVEGVGVQSGFPVSPLHSGSRFTGYQQSKGNKYHVEVEFKVCIVYVDRRTRWDMVLEGYPFVFQACR